MQWYKSNETVKRGFVASASTNDVFALKKNLNGQDVVIMANVRNSTVTFAVPTAWQGNWNAALSGAAYSLASTVTLAPFQCVIIQR